MERRTTFSYVWMIVAVACLAAHSPPTFAGPQSPPAVASGTLVVQLQADPTNLTLDGSDNVLSWTASNDNSIILNAVGADPDNIRYLSSELNGNGAIRVNDFSSDNQVLRGGVTGTRTAATVFWLGYFLPGRDGSLGDSSGQYVYSYGADGADGSQLDHQIDSGLMELYGGGTTQSGDNISALNGQYTIWRTVYGSGGGNEHAAFADAVNLNVMSPNGGAYSVSGNLQLFGYQNSSGVSGGFNFVGNIAELLIYDGILDSTDTTAVENYLASRIPEPATFGMLALGALALFRRSRLA